MDRNAQHMNYLRAHVLRSRWYKVFIAAAAIVVFITTYMLILPAITLDAKCGKEEHTHTEECYKVSTTLTCQQEEQSGHTHTEECYQTTDYLICGQEESGPVVEEIVNEETGETESVVVSEGHIHDANCYAQDTQLVCGQEESEGHTHAKECYTDDKKLNCSMTEHTHTDSCYHEQSDPNADVENEEIWKATFANVQLTGKWEEDIVAIAKTQVGYKESTKNFIYDQDDEKDGYTRYGAWYGDTYGEWCAMFSSFCLYYAQVGLDQYNQAYPLEANCVNWIDKLGQLGYYHSADNSLYMDQLGRETYTGTNYFVKPGDLIFFNLSQNEYKMSDHVGIVTEVTDKKITTIQGNSNYSVVEKSYDVGDVTIVGFGEVPENPNYVDPNKQEETKEETVAETKKETAKKSSAKKAASQAKSSANSGISLMAEGDTSDANAAAHDFTNNITYVSVWVNGISVSPTGGVYQVQENDTVKFGIEYSLPGGTLNNTNTITYKVPTSGITAQSGNVTGTINGQSATAGTYTVTSDGTVTIVFNENFVNQNKAGNTITGEISLSQRASSIVDSSSTEGHIKFNDQIDYTFRITDRTIKNYDLSLTKTQTAVANGKVTYTVKVSTTKGTDGQQVSLTDTLSKMQVNGNVTITDKNGSTIATITDKNGQSSFNYNLPAMNAGDEYTITYEAEVASSETGDVVYGSNTAKAEFTDTDGNKYDPSQTINTTFDRTPISKNGWQNGDKIDWTITVNDKNQNIAGWELTDEMMKGVDITVTGGSSSDYTYDKANGKLTFTDNGTNTNSYTVTFSTPITESQYGSSVKNTAIIKDKQNNPHTAEKDVWVNTPQTNNPVTKSGSKLSDGRIQWTITVVGSADVDLANKVLTDNAFKDPTFQLVSVVRDYWNGEHDVTQDYVLDTNAGTMTFHPTDSGENRHRYDIKYTVMPTYQFGQNTFTNVGQLSGYDEVTSTVDGGKITPGTKIGNGTTVENDIVIANWHVTIGENCELTGPWTFQDWLDENSGYFTMAQLKEIEASISQMGITNFTMVAFTDSSQSDASQGVTVNQSASGDGQYKKFLITFNDTLSKEGTISFDYHSTGLAADQSKTYSNHCNFNNDYQVDASVPYTYKPVLEKTNMYGTTMKFTENNPNMNYINWMLKIDIPAGTTDTEWVITEHVPAGLNPVYIDPILNDQNNNYPEDSNFSISYSKNDDGDYIIKFNPSLYAGQTKYIKVAGLVRESEIPMNADKTTAVKIYQNSASITYTGGKTYEVPPVDKRVEREYFDDTLAKGATFDEDTGIISYHIDINPEKVVDEVDKSYSVVDEITYNHGYCKLEIVPGSIVVKETLTGRVLNASECLIIEGEPVEDGTGNYKQKIYFTIVSDQKVCIEYQYKYTDVTQKLNGHEVNNHVTLENDRGWKSETSNQINNTYEESSASARVNSYPVYKVDAADHTTFLPGATFDIYKWDGSSYVIDASGVVTESDGSLRHPTGYVLNVAYKIVETAAPTGYQINSTPVEFYTKDRDTTRYPMIVPEDFGGTALNAGGVLYFEDTRLQGDRDTQISVKKKWVDYLGNDISNNVNTDIQFTLKQIENRYSGGGSSGGSDAIPGVVLKLLHSDGRYETVYMANACIGDSITAKVTHGYNVIGDDGSVIMQDDLKPTYNGSNDDSKAYDGVNKNAYCFPITVNSRVITIYTPYNSWNNVHIDFAYGSSGTSGGSGDSSSQLTGTTTTTVGTYTIQKSSGYVWTSSTLPAYRVNSDGTVSSYSYYIEELGVQGYITSYDRNDSVAGVSAGTITITNTQPNENEDTELSVQKVWRYSDNTLMIDEDKPANAVIEVWQIANGDKANAVQLTDKTVTLDSSNSWKTTLTNLPKVRKSGNDVTSYTYYFVEQVQAGYEISYSNGDTPLSQGTVIVTNKQTDTPEDKDTSVTAEKVWKDSSGNTIDAPTDKTIILDLYQIIDDGEPTKLEDKSVTLPDNGSWSKTVENLPLTRIDEENSAVEHQYKYYFVEREVPVGYEVSYTNTQNRPLTSGKETITNKKTTGISVNKQWRDADGNDITGSMGDASVDIQLIQTTGSNTSGGSAVKAKAAARSGGSYTVNYGFGHYGASGLVSGSKTCDSGTVMTITITSTNTPTVKTWPDGYSYDWNSTTLSPTGDPVDAGNGFQKYTYQVTITDNLNIGGITSDNDGTVTVSFSGGDSGGGDEGGGDSGGGESGGDEGGGDSGGDTQPTESVYATATLSAANNWTASFANLPTTGTNESGQTVNYKYYVKEISVPNYTTSYTNNGGITDGVITVTNTSTRTPEYTEVTIEKKWKGSDDVELSTSALEGKSARFKLMTYSGSNKDGATQYGDTFTLPENGSWTKTFTNLPKKTYDASGNAVHWKYYFEEVAAEEGTEINYQKESIFSFLPFVNGSENAEDQAIDGGTVTVTNTIQPEKTSISVEKIWQNSDGSIIDSSQVDESLVISGNLFKVTDGVLPGEQVNTEPIQLKKETLWKYSNDDLVKKDYIEGVEHNYTYYFVENSVSGYTTTYRSGTGQAVTTASEASLSGGTFNVINKQIPKTSVTVSKAWFKNLDGVVTNITGEKRGSITFELYRVKTKGGSTDPDVPTHEHTWDAGVITVEPGEYTDGVRTYTCSGCGATKTEPIGALGHTHNWSGSVTTAATCCSTGVRTYTCSGCNETYTEEIGVDSTNHTGGTYIDGYRAATETTDGYTGDTKCSGCGATLETGSVIPATGGGGGEDPPVTETVTISFITWGSVQHTLDVPKGSTVELTASYTNVWHPSVTASAGGTAFTITESGPDSNNLNLYSFIVTVADDMNIDITCDVAYYLSWNYTLISLPVKSAARSLNAAARLMSSPAGSTPVSETPSIPEGAEDLGSYSVYAENNWTGTWTFDAEEGYTYTYYVVETTTGEFTTTYEGQGSGNITINNTYHEEKSYELPHTGGMGTKLITMLGILFMAAASGLMILKKHRKEENW